MIEHETVIVVDANRQHVEMVSPAVARRALKDGFVTVFRKQPFSVQLPPGVDRCPRTFTRAKRAKERGNTVFNKTPQLRSFHKFFEENNEVWVKSLVEGQVSLQFESVPGKFQSVLVPEGDPICLTDRVPTDAVQTSTDLRKLCMPRNTPRGVKPAALKLLTHEEAEAHFLKKALRKKLFVKDETGQHVLDDDGKPIPDIEAAANPQITADAVTKAATRVDSRPSTTIREMQEFDASSVKDKEIKLASSVSPRVTALCNELQASPDDERQPADAVLDTLETIVSLTADDLHHIMANGFYPEVKTWAREQLDEYFPDADNGE